MKLFVGGKYVSQSGNLVRLIERLEGDDVYWRDDIGAGRCAKGTFRKWASRIHPDSLQTGPELEHETKSETTDFNREATNRLLESYLRLQNQIDVWTKNLEQTA